MHANEVSSATFHHGAFPILIELPLVRTFRSCLVHTDLSDLSVQIGHVKVILRIVPTAMACQMHAGVSSKDDISIRSVTAGPPRPRPGAIGKSDTDGKAGPTGSEGVKKPPGPSRMKNVQGLQEPLGE